MEHDLTLKGKITARPDNEAHSERCNLPLMSFFLLPSQQQI